ncbi:MAG TPA: phage tail tape measure protein, partial [Panacibacter sp.]|nr:phage tail tape measure protein [Panacibacter sp.]
MSVRTDTVNLIVNINGNAAQNQLVDLRKKAADIKLQMDGMTKGTKAYIAANAELKKVNADMDALKKTIGLTSLTQKELVAELNKLKALKGSVTPFSKEFNMLEKDIKAVEKRLYDVRNGVQGFSSFWSKINGQIKQFGVLAAGYLGFQFITSQISNLINRAAKYSDSLADIQRVTGLTAGETKRLNSELSALDTRTSTEGLRNIAIVAGKLGIEGVDNIVSFTAAVDKLVVALGDELGDADTITTELGKILNVFEGKVTGDNITHLGNAIVDLANKGVASAPFLVDFAQRVAGIAKTAGISLDAVLGMAAGMEESGAKVEASSTAFQKILSTIASDIPKAAKVAGMSLEEFNKLFAEQPQEALLRYAQGLQKDKQSFAEITASFKDAGEEGARTVAVLATLGQKTDFFREKMEDAGIAIKDTSEIQNAFNIKNETFGAELDKLGKTIGKWFTNSALSDFFKSIVTGLNNLFTPTKTAIQLFEDLNQKVQHLQNDILPLANRYDELKKKTNLSNDEQAEMKIIVGQIAAAMPGAVNGVDNYNNAISISTSRVRDFI